jgi:uncharacterized protein (TIGR02594 family)
MEKILPKHMTIAYQLLGIKELSGSANSPVIMGWAKELNLDDIYKDDSAMAWCGLFFAYVMMKADRKVVLPTKDKYDYLRALKYQNMPNVTEVAKGNESVGDILIFQRPEGGHIGFCVSASDTTFNVLGGNQSNSVSLTNIAKNRLVKCLRPNYKTYQPYIAYKKAVGEISNNEA